LLFGHPHMCVSVVVLPCCTHLKARTNELLLLLLLRWLLLFSLMLFFGWFVDAFVEKIVIDAVDTGVEIKGVIVAITIV